VSNRSKGDEHEQIGTGCETCSNASMWPGPARKGIAAEAERRGVRPGLEPTIETAYGVLASLAGKRLAALTTGEVADAEGDA
jgi:hypothetical protein